MDYADFFTLLELTLPTSSWLESNYPKMLTLLESTLLHLSQLEVVYPKTTLYSSQLAFLRVGSGD